MVVAVLTLLHRITFPPSSGKSPIVFLDVKDGEKGKTSVTLSDNIYKGSITSHTECKTAVRNELELARGKQHTKYIQNTCNNKTMENFSDCYQLHTKMESVN